jgi:threonyl-tRNA synthetase
MQSEYDHRLLGQRLDLFHMQEEAPGMVFWHPRGFAVYRALEDAVRRRVRRDGYREVRTPQILRRAIWEASGHWQNHAAGMFVVDDEQPAAIKPVSCPGHAQILKRMVPSYRDLPVRLAEFGLVHRNEPSGTMHGLFRLRQFTQDDGHVFCTEEQIEEEVVRFCASLVDVYAALGFRDIDVGFSTRPAERAGDDATWDRAESLLEAAARAAGLACRVQPGDGAFYGPKLEFALKDALGRSWQCGTIQLDLFMPERFDLAYVDASGARRRPAMLHRAIFGSLERFFGVLLEHSRGALPEWLAPDQVIVAPIAAAHRAYAEEVLARLDASSVRAVLDARDESLARKVAEAHARGAPMVMVVGQREVERRAVALRGRGGGSREMGLDDAILWVERCCGAPG